MLEKINSVSLWIVMFAAVILSLILFTLNSDMVDKLEDCKHELEYKDACIESLEMQLNGSFNEYNLYSQLVAEKVLFPRIVLNQAKLETGNFTSNAFYYNNNLFGFTGQNGLLKFETWIECVKYYKYWQEIKYKPVQNTEEEYYTFLLNLPYARDGDYVKKLKSFKQ